MPDHASVRFSFVWIFNIRSTDMQICTYDYCNSPKGTIRQWSPYKPTLGAYSLAKLEVLWQQRNISAKLFVPFFDILGKF